MSRRYDGAAAELETKKGTAPVSPFPTSASAGAQPEGQSVSNSIWNNYTSELLWLELKHHWMYGVKFSTRNHAKVVNKPPIYKHQTAIITLYECINTNTFVL